MPNAFQTPTALNQFSAIVNGANQNSLVSQLYAGKPASFASPVNTSTPQTVTQSPNVQAASSAVKNPATPSNASVASLLMGPLSTPTGTNASQVGSGSVPYTPTNTTPVINTPNASNPTSNPNASYNAGVTVPTNQPAGQVTAAPTGADASTGLTQQSLLGQEEALIGQQDSQQSQLAAQEQGLETNFANMNAGILSQPGEIGYQTGRQAQLQQTENTGLSALEQTGAQLAAYEQPQLTALGNAASQLSPQNQTITPPAGGTTYNALTGQSYSNPVLGQPGQTFYSPNGGSTTGTTGGAATEAPSGIDQTSWSQYIQDYSTGNFGAIPASITGNANLYGQLQTAVQQQSPGFSYNQATENVGVQGGLTPALSNATSQLNNLETTLQNAPPALQTPIPVLNSLLQAFSSSTGVGAGSSQAIQSAITDARAAMANALGVANNSTPSTYDSYVQTLIPDGATLAQVTAGIQQFNIQMQGKLQAYSNPGATQPTTAGTTSGTSLYDF